jgi:hypothetical protein
MIEDYRDLLLCDSTLPLREMCGNGLPRGEGGREGKKGRGGVKRRKGRRRERGWRERVC